MLIACRDRPQASSIESRTAILQSLGIDSLVIHSECDSTRKPVDGVCACLTDIPGGYCYHTSCDVVGIPAVLEEDRYAITVSPRERAARGR